ncbi:hypothetical protein HAHE_32630 [Haloferula helveola]|uniref:HEAT repeat domain-containing protein n=1 Tax=Haloferula helveola TaxID=490095 RepID=A0ABM7RHK9_9BACT|nr:hypothetical protein HAHE_32630 [Haloferula helveola]
MVVLLGAALCGCRRSDEPAGAAPSKDDAEKSGAKISKRTEFEPQEDPVIRVREKYNAAEQITDPEERTKALEAVAWDALELDPDLSLEAVNQLAAGSDGSRRLIGHMAMRLADEDAEQALQWVRALEDPAERSDAIGRVTVVMANEDPRRAADLAVNEMAEGRAKDKAVVQIVQRWVQIEPAEAAAWIILYPDTNVRTDGVRSMLDIWLSKDSASAGSWVGNLAPGPVRDHTLETAEELLHGRLADRAPAFVGALNDPELQTQFQSLRNAK